MLMANQRSHHPGRRHHVTDGLGVSDHDRATLWRRARRRRIFVTPNQIAATREQRMASAERIRQHSAELAAVARSI